jgi:hypothetical protein
VASGCLGVAGGSGRGVAAPPAGRRGNQVCRASGFSQRPGSPASRSPRARAQWGPARPQPGGQHCGHGSPARASHILILNGLFKLGPLWIARAPGPGRGGTGPSGSPARTAPVRVTLAEPWATAPPAGLCCPAGWRRTDGLPDLLLLLRSAGPCGPAWRRRTRTDGLPDLLLLLRSAGPCGPAWRRRTRTDGLPDRLLLLRRPVSAALPGGDGLGRTDYQTGCCCFARLAPVVLPDGDGWTDYQTGCCCSAGRSLLRMEAGPFLRWTMHGVHPSRFRGQRAWLPLSPSQQA